jgi:hypothetical protein
MNICHHHTLSHKWLFLMESQVVFLIRQNLDFKHDIHFKTINPVHLKSQLVFIVPSNSSIVFVFIHSSSDHKNNKNLKLKHLLANYQLQKSHSKQHVLNKNWTREYYFNKDNHIYVIELSNPEQKSQFSMISFHLRKFTDV